MEVKEMKELIAAVSSANVDEFEYNNEEFSIRIAKKKAKIATVDASVAGVPVQSAAIMPEQNEEQPEEILYGDVYKRQVVIAAITGLSVKDDKNIPIAINTHPSRKKARMDE